MPDGVVRDHPRLRGEQHADPWHKCKRGGSPPLARGTVVVLKSVEVERGITPACAGNRPWRRRQKNEAKDHPRLRGEQFLSFAASLRQMGSPPLARGTAISRRFGKMFCGITPACAGNRNAGALWGRKHGDHPRLRGEQARSSKGARGRLGSPPLARGTAYSGSAPRAYIGITPACAGNSF